MTERIYRSLRGGAWLNNPENLSLAHRYGIHPGHRLNDLGFRLVIVEKDAQVIPESLFKKFRVEAEEHSKELLRRLAKGSSE